MYVVFKVVVNNTESAKVKLFVEKLETTGETIEFDTVMMVANGDDIQIGAQSLRALKMRWLLTVAAIKLRL